MGGQRRKKIKTSKATNVCPPSLRKEREDRGGKARDREREREEEREREKEVVEGGRELGGDWPSYTAQYDTHFSSLHTYSRDQGTGII